MGIPALEVSVWPTDRRSQRELLRRAAVGSNVTAQQDARRIVAEVKQRGDAAVRQYTHDLDGVALDTFRVADGELRAAYEALPTQLQTALEMARTNITTFHTLGIPKDAATETTPGITCAYLWRPISHVGLYVPGGTAPLFSTVLMLAIPAKLAGCPRVALCAPPNREGKIHDSIAAAAYLTGVDEVYAVGGAQAIAAMAYGTEQIGKVDKICGPGNAWVTAAKQIVAADPDGAAYDMPAGPSEVMVLAERGNNPQWVAADLLAQSEHDVLSQAILVTNDAEFAREVIVQVQQQTPRLPRREIVERSLENARFIVADDEAAILEVANLYAAEHLIVHLDNADQLLPRITNAGSVFVGPYSSEAGGDYVTGTNHTLPTYGAATSHNGINVQTFMRAMTAQWATPAGAAAIAPAIAALASAEGLQGHANAGTLRGAS